MSENKPDVVADETETLEGGRRELSADDGQYSTVETISNGERVLYPRSSRWHEVAALLLADGWNMCLDITAVDYLTYPGERSLPAGVVAERYEVVATFISYIRSERIQARVQVSDANPVLSSLYPVFPGVDYAEREIFDLFGIEFDGHPDLSRILMPEEWEGHPLRKDYSVGGIPVQFKAPASTEEATRP